MKELTLSGTYFEAGAALGKATKAAIRGCLRHDRAALRLAEKKQGKQIARTRSLLGRAYPERMDEMRGIAAGAGVSETDVLLENMPEILYKDSGCTTIALKNAHGAAIVHNEDELAWKTLNNYALAHYAIAGMKNAHALCSPPELPGNAFGWNDHIFYAVNFVPVAEIAPRGIPRYVEARGLLEHASIHNALGYLRGITAMSGFHYTIGEFGTRRIVSVERKHDNMSVVEIADICRHTNHFIHQQFASSPEWNAEYSARRLSIANERFSGKESAKQAVRILRKYLRRPLDKRDDSKTFATVSAELTEGIVTVIA